MKKTLLWVLIISVISVFSLAGCKAEIKKEVEVAEKAVVAAEEATVNLSTQELIDSAQALYYTALPLVTALETGEVKDDLTARLETVKTTISSAKVLLDEVAATEAVVATESATIDLSTKELVDMVTGLYNTANSLVTALPNGSVKDNLTARLVVVQDAIEEASSILAGPKIAFVSGRDGNAEIYIMNIDGSGVTRLTNNLADDYSPCFSPDGSKIAFESNRDGNLEIYIMNVDGSEQTRLTNYPEEDMGPCFSPDGSKIVFSAWRDGNEDIYIMNVDGSEIIRLTDTNFPVGSGGPCFSPDGEKIAFLSDQIHYPNMEIYIMNVDGTEQTRLTNNPGYDWFPCFSPDGSKIAFASDRDGNDEIYIMNVDGSGVTRLTNNPARDLIPSISPDGLKIIFESDRDGNGEIYIMNIDGSDQTNLTNNPAYDGSPCFSN